jgi:pimeloyl-ACP methyl ester carboxylesterase
MGASTKVIQLHYEEEGAGRAVLLLHGFPDGMPTWRAQRTALVAAQYRVIAPALRGYGQSGRPHGVPAYDIDLLVADVAALIRARGATPLAALVGHDWGGAIAWRLAARHPELIHRLIILNAPHPAILARELRRPAQLLKSWYTFFFQLPWLPERILAARDYRWLRRAIESSLQHGRFTEAEWWEHRAEIAVPGALTAALNYYRAAGRRLLWELRGPGGERKSSTVETPTLVLWGERDPFLGSAMLRGLERWVPRLEIERFPKAGHWVHRDEAGRVNAAILGFLARPV